MKKLIYIFGANGQLGRSIYKQLKKKYIVIKYNKKNLDICSNKYYQLKIPKIIINCAAYTDVDKSERNKKIANNVNNLALVKLSKFCKKNKILLIHFSTDFVFDGKIKSCYNEKSKTNPINFYGLSKLRGEEKISKYLDNYFIFRISWLYSKQKNNFPQIIKLKLQKKKPFSVVNNLYGTPTSCDYISSFIYHNIDKLLNFKKKQRIFHLTNGSKISKYEFAKKIQNYLKNKDLIFESKYLYSGSLAKRPDNTALASKFLNKYFKIINNNWEKDLKKVL